MQCISPGIVETEFAFRHHNSDPEKAAAVYESMKVSEHRRLRVNICMYVSAVASVTPPLSTSQCLKAEDIASAVTFVLSAPAHVQVRLSLAILPPSASVLNSAVSALISLTCACRLEMCR